MLMRYSLTEMQMAVFLQNNCTFSGCGLKFKTLKGLIQHIEESHIDSDPSLLEKQEKKQPGALALSYILKCFKEGSKIKHEEINILDDRQLSPTESPRSVTPAGSEFDDDADDFNSSDDEDSDDSVMTGKEECTSKFILRMVNIKEVTENEDRPFCCPMPGCKKRYKNINGIKYHAKNGHKTDTTLSKIPKLYHCHCGKNYKTAHGLRNHSVLCHSAIQVYKHGKNDLITSQTVYHVKRISRPAIKTLQPYKGAKSILSTPINEDLLTDNLQRYQLPLATTEGDEGFL